MTHTGKHVLTPYEPMHEVEGFDKTSIILFGMFEGQRIGVCEVYCQHDARFIRTACNSYDSTQAELTRLREERHKLLVALRACGGVMSTFHHAGFASLLNWSSERENQFTDAYNKTQAIMADIELSDPEAIARSKDQK